MTRRSKTCSQSTSTLPSGLAVEKPLSYLRTLPGQFEPLKFWEHSAMWGELETDPELTDSFAAAETVAGFRPLLERNRGHDDPTRELSGLCLEMHADINERRGPAVAVKARGDEEVARQRWRNLRADIYHREETFHRALDVYWFVDDMDNMFGISAADSP